jgi:hypothetical protein
MGTPAAIVAPAGARRAAPATRRGDATECAIATRRWNVFAAAALCRRMRRLRTYLATLSGGRTVLWCYAIWYAVTVVHHFDPRPTLWLTSAGLSAIIGIALVISTRTSSTGTMRLDRWQVLRLFLMPFCVSSFAALVKDAGYVLVFPPTLHENLMGAAAIALFLLLVLSLRAAQRGSELSSR